MSVLLVTHDAFADHVTGPHHPESASRLAAVRGGIAAAGVDEAVTAVAPREATVAELTTVHAPDYVEAIRRFCAAGGGPLDPDTWASVGSWEAALRAAGAGLEAAERLERGEGTAAFCAVRPPGHHALAGRAMGFCLFNNIAVCAAVLAARGERVLILDWDAHHGNGTQAAFWTDDRVAAVSLHQYPLWPMSGTLDEVGEGAGRGLTANVPLPPGATGDHELRAVDEVVAPLAARLRPSWVLISAGFDAHRADPLTQMGLSAGDFGLLAARARELAPPGRVIAFLEGGYDLEALARSAGACVAALAGERWLPEAPTTGGPGAEVVAAAAGRASRIG
ncbi:MAG TPA: histone deacetylase [Acidimicrobiales bacterium]